MASESPVRQLSANPSPTSALNDLHIAGAALADLAVASDELRKLQIDIVALCLERMLEPFIDEEGVLRLRPVTH